VSEVIKTGRTLYYNWLEDRLVLIKSIVMYVYALQQKLYTFTRKGVFTTPSPLAVTVTALQTAWKWMLYSS